MKKYSVVKSPISINTPTHRIGSIIASGDLLTRVFGKPTEYADDEDALAPTSAYDWEFKINGHIFNIYDFKATSLSEDGLPSPKTYYHSKTSHWSVGGTNASVAYVHQLYGAIAQKLSKGEFLTFLKNMIKERHVAAAGGVYGNIRFSADEEHYYGKRNTKSIVNIAIDGAREGGIDYPEFKDLETGHANVMSSFEKSKLLKVKESEDFSLLADLLVERRMDYISKKFGNWTATNMGDSGIELAAEDVSFRLSEGALSDLFRVFELGKSIKLNSSNDGVVRFALAKDGDGYDVYLTKWPESVVRLTKGDVEELGKLIK